ncbi:hypothetical protein [uncultured Shewanella sp.]|uniref:hypothetical protein n=1 Tax=uncultured Shewanella sp. TaxID=173975 RepID=UPI002606838D|nr:hypothetical protein [uncultured Shewanella sp.]
MRLNQKKSNHSITHPCFQYSFLFSAIILSMLGNRLQAETGFEDICEFKDTDTDLVECTFPATQSHVDIESLILPMIQEFDPRADYDTPFWVSSWGGNGGKSSYNDFDGRGGYGGYGFFSATLYTFAQAFQQTELHYFVGEAGIHIHISSSSSGTGGASSIVALQANLSEINADSSIKDRVLLIAGGGGGSGTGYVTGHQHDGGDGGVVLPVEGVSVYAQGNDGGNGYYDSYNGLGGSSEGEGLGGMGGSSVESRSGSDGFGGKGGGMVYQGTSYEQTGWLADSPVLVSEADGSGGMGNKKYSGGGGGGGYGGGGAGRGSDSSSENAGFFGGGGGGSLGHGNLITASNQPQAYESHDINDGEVKITFDLSESFSPNLNCYKTLLNVETDYLVTCEFPIEDKNGDAIYKVEIDRLLFDANVAAGVSLTDYFIEGSGIIDGDTPAWISAYGGAGQGEEIDLSLDYTQSSMAGARGYAQTQLSLNDLDSDTLYYYIGSEGPYSGWGGQATLVTTSELSEVNPLSSTNALLVAGGGGGAGLTYGYDDTDYHYGGSGGAGGIAIASYDVAGIATGEDGYSSLEGYQGQGGNSDGQGAGGTGGTAQDGIVNSLSTGNTGWGGNTGWLIDYIDGVYTDDCFEAEGQVSWVTGTPYFDEAAGQGGHGLKATSDHLSQFSCQDYYRYDMAGQFYGAIGGGGYGGGGGSQLYYEEDVYEYIPSSPEELDDDIDYYLESYPFAYDTSYVAGAGGAGSYSAPATIASDAYQPLAEDIVPTTGDGEVSITFHVTL